MHPTEPRHARWPGETDKPRRRTSIESTPCGPFRLGEVIGHSATSTVFLATRGSETTDPSGPFAVKKLTGDGRESPLPREQVEAFLREIRLMRRVQHPAVVTVVDHASAPAEEPYLALELLDGLALDRVSRRLERAEGSLSSALAAFIAREVASALGHVHGLHDDQGRPLGVVHGALRPKEIVLLRDGQTKLLAFGPGNTGTPALSGPRRRRMPATYRAPEQILGRPIDARTDLFSLGAILWELLVGPPLFAGSTEEEAVAAVLTREIPPPSSLRKGIPARLDAIVMKALARDPRRRHPNAEAMVAELSRGLRDRAKLLSHSADLIADLTGIPRDDSVPLSVAARSQRTADFFAEATAVRPVSNRTPVTAVPQSRSTSTSTRILDVTLGLRHAAGNTPPMSTLDDDITGVRLRPQRNRDHGSPPPLPKSPRQEAPSLPMKKSGRAAPPPAGAPKTSGLPTPAPLRTPAPVRAPSLARPPTPVGMPPAGRTTAPVRGFAMKGTPGPTPAPAVPRYTTPGATPTPASAPEKRQTPGRIAASGFIDGRDSLPPGEPLLEPSISFPGSYTTTETFPIRRHNHGEGRHGTAIVLTRSPRFLAEFGFGPWYLKLAAIVLTAAIGFAVWHGRGPWRERANAATSGPDRRPEIIIADPQPAAVATSDAPAAAAKAPEGAAAATSVAAAAPNGTAKSAAVKTGKTATKSRRSARARAMAPQWTSNRAPLRRRNH